MGKLTYAPVFYVVAQVTHSPILKLDSLIPDLQDRLRKEGFPGYRNQKQLALQIRSNPDALNETKVEPTEITSHVFSTRDQSESFVFGRDSFALQTVEYDTIDAFVATFAKGIRAFQDIFAPDSFTRIGLRFLDAVTPPASGQLSSYIRKQFLGLQDILGENWQTAYTFSETLLSRADQQTKVRVLTRHSEIRWPDDLTATAPTLPERFATINGVHALLDSDASFAADEEGAQEFGENVIIERLKGLKTDIRDSFKAVVTEAALEDWK
jgi:uncharacterized protein (TIGR04255 family)